MLGRTTFLALALLSACATSVQGPGEAQVDAANPIGLADASGTSFADARPAPADAAPIIPAPDAASSTVEATITASCLFLRSGAGTENAKVVCSEAGPWCNADNDVCIPMGDTVTITGASQAGTGCNADWHPISYEIYEGFACGSFLEFPSSAAEFQVERTQTLYPSFADGAQG